MKEKGVQYDVLLFGEETFTLRPQEWQAIGEVRLGWQKRSQHFFVIEKRPIGLQISEQEGELKGRSF